MAMKDFIDNVAHDVEQVGRDLNRLTGMVGCTVVNTNLWFGKKIHHAITSEEEKGRFHIGAHDYIVLFCCTGKYKVKVTKKPVANNVTRPWDNDPFAWEEILSDVSKEEAFDYIEKKKMES